MMRCVTCGQMLDDNNRFCPICGTVVDKTKVVHIDNPWDEKTLENNNSSSENYNSNMYGQNMNNPNMYGQYGNYNNYNNYSQLPKTNVFSIIGFIFGLLGSWLGIVFSIIALVEISNNKETQKGKGLAIAGLILSIIGLIFSIYAIKSGAYEKMLAELVSDMYKS